MLPRKPRTDYSRRPKAAWLPYPAVILDPFLLDSLGVIHGTRPDEDPPKVVMTRADWSKLAADPSRARRAIRFLGETWQDNPLIAPPTDAEPAAPQSRYKYRPKKRGQFAHLKELPLEAAIARAKAEHAERLAAGHDAEKSTRLLIRALETVKRAAASHVEPRPLPTIEGDDPPTPTQLRQMAQDVR